MLVVVVAAVCCETLVKVKEEIDKDAPETS